jgi:hypothetical protein
MYITDPHNVSATSCHLQGFDHKGIQEHDVS